MLTDFLNLFWPVCAFAVLLMAFVWWLALRLNNLGIVDIAWSYSFAPVVIFYGLAAHGDEMRRGLAAGMGLLWSLRLGTHICLRVIRHHPREDARYSEMRTSWRKHFGWRVFLFFELQALLVAALSLPFLIASVNPRPGISALEWCGVALWALALAGESVADWQLKKFQARPENRGQVCRVGLWNYSRHPNYFFEWLVWVAFYLFALGSPFGCATIFCPALMLYFLVRVTGIPLTERLSVENKGPAYLEYQRTTSAFVPWFRREDSTPNHRAET